MRRAGVKRTNLRITNFFPKTKKPIRTEVVIMNSLTANVHYGMVAFYRPTANRHKVLMEHKAFPSDHYAVKSQIRFHGYDPAVSLVTVDPREGEDTLRTEDIVAKIMEEGDSIALVLFSGAQYFTGQFFNIAAITEAAHSKAWSYNQEQLVFNCLIHQCWKLSVY